MTTTKGAKVEFTILLIWYGKLPGESEKKKGKKDNVILVGLGGLW